MPFDDNGNWVDGKYSNNGGMFGGALDLMNAWNQRSLGQKKSADELYARGKTQYSNPQYSEGFGQTAQGKEAMKSWGEDPETYDAAVNSSPWAKEREAMKDYDPEDDETGSGLYRLYQQAGDTAGAKTQAGIVNQNTRSATTLAKQSQVDDQKREREEAALYAKQRYQALEEIRKNLAENLKGEMGARDAVDRAKAMSPSYDMLKPEHKQQIDDHFEQMYNLAHSNDPLPGVKAKGDATRAQAKERIARAGLEGARTANEPLKGEKLKAETGLIGAKTVTEAERPDVQKSVAEKNRAAVADIPAKAEDRRTNAQAHAASVTTIAPGSKKGGLIDTPDTPPSQTPVAGKKAASPSVPVSKKNPINPKNPPPMNFKDEADFVAKYTAKRKIAPTPEKIEKARADGWF